MSVVVFLAGVLWIGYYLVMSGNTTTLPTSSSDEHLGRLEDPKEVLIIGGGLAGLAALVELLKKGVTNVALLEAQDYLGGRIKTLRKGSLIIEEGAHWIHGDERNPLHNIAKELKALSPSFSAYNYDYMLRRSDGTTNLMDEGIQEKIEGFFLDSLGNGKLEDFYKGGYGEYFKARMKSDNLTSSLAPKMKKSWLHYIEEVVNKQEGTSDWNDISAIDADNFVSYGENHMWKNGFDTIIKHLMASVPSNIVHLNMPVEKILWDEPKLSGKVEVVTQDGRRFLANRVLVTISVGCLKNSHHQLFQPPLPTGLTTALKHIQLGNANKVFLHWESPWWGTRHLYLHILRMNFNTPKEMKWIEGIVGIFSLEHSSKTLMMFVSGNYSLQMENLPEDKVKEHVMFLLRKIFKDDSIPDPTYVKTTKWNNNRWTLGSYGTFISIDGASSGLHSRSIYQQPLKNAQNKSVIFWAGEHTHTTRYGTTDGAYSSGLREADKIIGRPQRGPDHWGRTGWACSIGRTIKKWSYERCIAGSTRLPWRSHQNF